MYHFSIAPYAATISLNHMKDGLPLFLHLTALAHEGVHMKDSAQQLVNIRVGEFRMAFTCQFL